jgi:hypothetical protein
LFHHKTCFPVATQALTPTANTNCALRAQGAQRKIVAATFAAQTKVRTANQEMNDSSARLKSRSDAKPITSEFFGGAHILCPDAKASWRQG